MSKRGSTWSKSLIELPFCCHVGQGCLQCGQGVGGGAADQVLGSEHAGHTGAGFAQGLDAGGPGLQGAIFGVGQFEHAADNDAQHGDFVFEVAGQQQVKVVQLLGPELTGVESVLDGVGVAWLGAAGAFGFKEIFLFLFQGSLCEQDMAMHFKHAL